MGSAFTIPVFGYAVDVTWTAIIMLAMMVFLNAGDGTTFSAYANGIVWGAVVFGSILVHELGHALVGERLGLRPQRIVLHGFGGLCAYGRVPRGWSGIAASFAGPGAGLLLGGLALLAKVLVGGQGPVGIDVTLGWLASVNLFWSLFNLLPMFPLDGGAAANHALAMVLGPLRATPFSRNLSIATAIPVGVIGYFAGFTFVPFIAVLVIFENLQR